MISNNISRRHFCLHIPKALVLINIAGPGVFAMGPKHGQAFLNTIVIDLTKSENKKLSIVGGAQYIESDLLTQPLIVVRNSNIKVAAFSSICPHKGAKVNLPKNNVAECPWHGSQFDATGKLIKGPAVHDLKTYPARVEADTIIISLDNTGVKSQIVNEHFINVAGLLKSNATFVVRFKTNEEPIRMNFYSMKGSLVQSVSEFTNDSAVVDVKTWSKGIYIFHVVFKTFTISNSFVL